MIEFILKKKYLDEEYISHKKEISDKVRNKYFNIMATGFLIICLSGSLIISFQNNIINELIIASIVTNIFLYFRIKKTLIFKLLLIFINLLASVIFIYGTIDKINIYFLVILYIIHIILYIILSIAMEFSYYNTILKKKERTRASKKARNIIASLIILLVCLEDQSITNVVSIIILSPCMTMFEGLALKGRRKLF